MTVASDKKYNRIEGERVTKISATEGAREALITEFVSQWGFPNKVEDAEFERNLRGLLDGLGLPSLASQKDPKNQDDSPVGGDDHAAHSPRKRKIILFDESS